MKFADAVDTLRSIQKRSVAAEDQEALDIAISVVASAIGTEWDADLMEASARAASPSYVTHGPILSEISPEQVEIFIEAGVKFARTLTREQKTRFMKEISPMALASLDAKNATMAKEAWTRISKEFSAEVMS